MKLGSDSQAGGKTAVGLIAGVFALGITAVLSTNGMETSQQNKMDGDRNFMAMDPVARAKHNMSELKTQLNFINTQEPALQTFSDQMNEQAKNMMREQEKMKDISSKNAPEHMAMMADVAKTRAKNMTNMAESVSTFYATLNREQQATFDELDLSHQRQLSE